MLFLPRLLSINADLAWRWLNERFPGGRISPLGFGGLKESPRCAEVFLFLSLWETKRRRSQGGVQADRRSPHLCVLLSLSLSSSFLHFLTFSPSFIMTSFSNPSSFYFARSLPPSSHQRLARTKYFRCRCLGNRPIQSGALHCVSREELAVLSVSSWRSCLRRTVW